MTDNNSSQMDYFDACGRIRKARNEVISKSSQGCDESILIHGGKIYGSTAQFTGDERQQNA